MSYVEVFDQAADIAKDATTAVGVTAGIGLASFAATGTAAVMLGLPLECGIQLLHLAPQALDLGSCTGAAVGGIIGCAGVFKAASSILKHGFSDEDKPSGTLLEKTVFYAGAAIGSGSLLTMLAMNHV